MHIKDANVTRVQSEDSLLFNQSHWPSRLCTLSIQPKIVLTVPRMVNQGWCLLHTSMVKHRMVTPEMASINCRATNLDMVSFEYRMVNLEMV
jgi:hypothetical protein